MYSQLKLCFSFRSLRKGPHFTPKITTWRRFQNCCQFGITRWSLWFDYRKARGCQGNITYSLVIFAGVQLSGKKKAIKGVSGETFQTGKFSSSAGFLFKVINVEKMRKRHQEG